MTGPVDLLADLLAFIDASPTPFHVVAAAGERLRAAGFAPIAWTDELRGLSPGRYYLTAADSALFAFVLPVERSPAPRFCILGAHTDSPNLRVKPLGAYEKAGYFQLGVEVYGGVLLNSWLDRDLHMAGRAIVRRPDGTLHTRLIRLTQPLVRVPQLAIHLDREINDKGLLLNRQEHMPPIVGLVPLPAGRAPRELLADLCAQHLGVSAADLVGLDLMLSDSVPAALGGFSGELLFAPRLDNLAMCHAALSALRTAAPAEGTVPVVALFDHEEVGSGSLSGAAGPLLPSLLERIAGALGDGSRESYLRMLMRSCCVSADMAHAVHPNYADRHEAHHRPMPNGGPVIKHNAQQRYATCARTAAHFAEVCRLAEVPTQRYVHRTDLPCGSTIGPITATLLGIPTVDVGSAMLSMHSCRELAGSQDPAWMVRALTALLASAW